MNFQEPTMTVEEEVEGGSRKKPRLNNNNNNNHQKYYDEARQYLEQAASSGDSHASFLLGIAYHNGDNEYGIHSPDLEKSISFLTQAVEGGHQEAMFYLADLYLHPPSNNGAIDARAKALQLYERSAKLGHVPSMINLGVLKAGDSSIHTSTTISSTSSKRLTIAYFEDLFLKKQQQQQQYRQEHKDEDHQWYNYYLGFLYVLPEEEEEKDSCGETERIVDPYNGEKMPKRKGSVKQRLNEEDIKKAMDYWESAASIGHLRSILQLAEIYCDGITTVIKRDRKKAEKYYLQVIDSRGERIEDDIREEAMFTLAQLYLEGVFPDPYGKKGIKGIKLLQQAANQGHIEASFALAILHTTGQCQCFGLIVDLTKAIHYYEEAAKRGHVQALSSLAGIYTKGYRAPGSKGSGMNNNSKNRIAANFSLAIELHRQAAYKGSIDSMFFLGTLYEGGDKATKKHGIVEDRERAVWWYEQAAKKGHCQAMYNLGNLYMTSYEKNTHSIEDKAKAIEYFEQAKDCGDMDACYNLGCIYYEEALRFDIGEAEVHALPTQQQASWINLAIACFKKCLGIKQASLHPNAAYNLGTIYYHGQCGIEVDIDQAIYYFKLAVKQGSNKDMKAMYNLGVIYEYGEGSNSIVDLSQAIKYYQQVASGGSVAAMFNLAVLYSQGKEGVMSADITKAMAYYKEGAEWYNDQTKHLKGNDDIEEDAEEEEVDEEEVDEEEEEVEEEEDALDKRDDQWLSDWCRYGLGQLYNRMSQFSKAKECFETNIAHSFYLGYVGLATLPDTDTNNLDVKVRIECLIKAAEHGIVEAWEILSSHSEYADHEYLLQVWSTEHIATLQAMREKAKREDREEAQCLPLHRLLCSSKATTVTNTHCSICRQQQLIQLSKGVNRSIMTNPSCSHIDSQLFHLYQMKKRTVKVVKVDKVRYF